ncbi:hypothetical protein BDB01DRAFT_710373, partial [Pilobolus umbonatus]
DPSYIISGLPLLPFTNQVGGHTSFFRFSKKAVCKPALKREQEFYVHLESHHPGLLPFISQYLGVLNVTYPQSNQNSIMLPEFLFDQNQHIMNAWRALIQSPDSMQQNYHEEEEMEDLTRKDFQQWSPNPDECQSRFKAFQRKVVREVFDIDAYRARLKAVDDLRRKDLYMNLSMPPSPPSSFENITIQPRQPSIIASTTSAPHDMNTMDGSINTSSSMIALPTLLTHSPDACSVSSDTENDPKTIPSSAHFQPRRTPNNPWSLQVYERDQLKLQQLTAESEVTKQFTLLEDLTDNIVYPCVLDLKMGTRQHGVYASQKKVMSQTLKCKESTSESLGVRVCGMQLYDMHIGDYIFRDKYYGRTLDYEMFKNTLTSYLCNGRLQTEYIPILIRKLSRLSRIIQSLDKYRFYGSSLLIIYDAQSADKKKIDV